MREGFALIAPNAEDVGVAFYRTLFALEPSLRMLFPGDTRPQARKLMAALTTVVDALDDLAPLIDQISALGRRHIGYGVTEDHYQAVGAALLATLRSGLGDALTGEAHDAWAHAYWTLANAMIAAMKEGMPVAA